MPSLATIRLGAALRYLLRTRKLTQEELGKRIGASGIDRVASALGDFVLLHNIGRDLILDALHLSRGLMLEAATEVEPGRDNDAH